MCYLPGGQANLGRASLGSPVQMPNDIPEAWTTGAMVNNPKPGRRIP